MFQLSRDETDALVSQNVIASVRSLGGGLPYVFTEQGVAMLSSVLTSRRAVQVNIAILRAFVKLRQLLENHKDLLQKVGALERTQKEHTVQIKPFSMRSENSLWLRQNRLNTVSDSSRPQIKSNAAITFCHHTVCKPALRAGEGIAGPVRIEAFCGRTRRCRRR